MNLQLAQQIETLGPGAPEAKQLIQNRQFPPDYRFIALNEREQLDSIAAGIRTLALSQEGADEDANFYTRTIDFAGTSLHVVLSAGFRLGTNYRSRRASIATSAAARWTSDQFPDDVSVAFEQVAKRGSGLSSSAFRQPRFVLRDALALRESVAEARKYLGSAALR